MEQKSCFFIGHREAGSEMMPQLQYEVECHILECGVTDFFVGGYGGFDRTAARAVLLAKKKYPHITLTLLLPYHPAERPTELPPGFDGSYYPPGQERVPRRLAILRANRHMVEEADYLIAYAWHPGSNARNLLEYAREREAKGGISVTALQRPAE